jgi:hypothetical protein
MKSPFVGNLNFQTTEADLTALFQPFGQVGRIHNVTDRKTDVLADLLLWKCPMTPKQQRPSQPSTERKREAATSRSKKPAPNARHAATAAEGAPAVAAVAADSRTRIIASRNASRANRAGNVLILEKAASKETDEHHVPKTPERTEAAGKTKSEGCET